MSCKVIVVLLCIMFLLLIINDYVMFMSMVPDLGGNWLFTLHPKKGCTAGLEGPDEGLDCWCIGNLADLLMASRKMGETKMSTVDTILNQGFVWGFSRVWGRDWMMLVGIGFEDSPPAAWKIEDWE